MIGIICFAIILMSWFGSYRYPKGIPAGLVAIAAGLLIGWGSTLLGLYAYLLPLALYAAWISIAQVGSLTFAPGGAASARDAAAKVAHTRAATMKKRRSDGRCVDMGTRATGTRTFFS